MTGSPRESAVWIPSYFQDFLSHKNRLLCLLNEIREVGCKILKPCGISTLQITLCDPVGRIRNTVERIVQVFVELDCLAGCSTEGLTTRLDACVYSATARR